MKVDGLPLPTDEGGARADMRSSKDGVTEMTVFVVAFQVWAKTMLLSKRS